MAIQYRLGQDWDPRRINNQCIYCDTIITRKNRSKEDYWPRWFQKRFPQKRGERSSHFRRDGSGELTRYAGRSTLRDKITAICRTCNNGFGSRLQEAAKPAIFDLMRYDFRSLSSLQLENLARWAVMFTMTFEFVDPRSKMISQRTRALFAANQNIPSGMKVWLGRYSGTGFQFSPQHLSRPMESFRYSDEIQQAFEIGDFTGLFRDGQRALLQITAQITTVAIGPIFLMVYSSETFDGREISPFLVPNDEGWGQLCEITTPTESWHTADRMPLADDTVQAISIEALQLNNRMEGFLEHGEIKRVEAAPGLDPDFWRDWTTEPAWRRRDEA